MEHLSLVLPVILKKSQVYFCEELYTGSRTSHTGRIESLVKLALFDHGIFMYFSGLRAVGGETEEYMNQTCQLVAHIGVFPSWSCIFLVEAFSLSETQRESKM